MVPGTYVAAIVTGVRGPRACHPVIFKEEDVEQLVWSPLMYLGFQAVHSSFQNRRGFIKEIR